ncbi:MAG: hypothetical protein IJA20_02245 [Methanocorpusculum sp.]|nr:hypothetical protein [Methanocorpusculum sp.]
MNFLKELLFQKRIKDLQKKINAPVRGLHIEGDHSYLATYTELKKILARRVDPILSAEGYSYDGAYQWIGPWENDHSRRIIKTSLLKGAGVIYMWGRCYDFIPVISNDGKSYRYQRTDKSAGLQMFPRPTDLHAAPIPEMKGVPKEFSLFGPDLADVERRTFDAFIETKPLWETWFGLTEGYEAAIAELDRQINYGYSVNWPAVAYVKAFLLAVHEGPDIGLEALNTYFQDEYYTPPAEDMQDKIRAKLLSLPKL